MPAPGRSNAGLVAGDGPTNRPPTGVEAEEWTNDELVERFSELAGHLHSGTARFLVMLGEIDDRRIWADHGAKTCAEWLSWRVGISGVAAREHLRVARALKDLPATTEAFVSGSISYSKVRAMTRIATPTTEVDLVTWATHTTAADIERFCRTYRRVVGEAELEEANERHDRRHLSWYFDDDGSMVIVGRLSPEEGALVVRALEAGRALVRKAPPAHGKESEGNVSAETSDRQAPTVVDGEAADERKDDSARASAENVSAETSAAQEPAASPTPASNADALVAMAHHLLADPPADSAQGSIPQLLVHVDLEVLRARDERATSCALHGGPWLPPETARRLGCECSVVTVVEKDGEPLGATEKTRTIPTAVRRALSARDSCCRWPGCNRSAFLQAHHIVFWGRGGTHDLTNLVLLCWHHHRLLHEGGFGMERSGPAAFRFYRPDGSEIEQVPEPPCSGPGLLEKTTAAAGIAIESETCVPDWDGTFLDPDIAADALLAASGSFSRP